MKQIHRISAIADLGNKYPNKESAIIPALFYLQDQNDQTLDEQDIKDVASALNVSLSKVFGVATYYTMFNTQPVGRYHLQVDTNIPSQLMGAEEIVSHLEKKLHIRPGETTSDGLFTLSTVEDLGSAGTTPVIQVNDIYYESMTIDKVDQLIASLKTGKMPARDTIHNWGTTCGILLKNRDNPEALTIDGYKASGGYAALEKARNMLPEEVIDKVKSAQLRGRGGAGFPAGVKWGFLPPNDHRPVYLICNADEGEPGTFKDRQIMEYDPHLVIEGIAIAAYATGADKTFIYIRGEFGWIATILERAIEEAKIDGRLKNLDIVVHRGAGSYVCGEETALIESLEGKRGNPRLKPPFPANVGLYGCPTIVNNVETLACLPFIIDKGPEKFKEIGTENNYGPRLFCVSGHVNKPGVYELPLGTPLTEILKWAGGVRGQMKTVMVGGLSSPIMKADEVQNLNMDFDSCQKAGTMLGSAAIIVMNETVSIPRIALRAMKFYAHESCGQCVPCREGTHTMVAHLERLIDGKGNMADLESLNHLSRVIHGLTLCPGGDASAMPMQAMLSKFQDEFKDLVG